MFHGYLFIIYFIAQHNGMRNLKSTRFWLNFMSVDYCNNVVALKPHSYDWYGVFDKQLSLMGNWTSWERWTCQNTGHWSVSHRVSVNVTQYKGIASGYLSSRDLSCSHGSFLLGKWTSGVYVCVWVCGGGGVVVGCDSLFVVMADLKIVFCLSARS
jgi:hypothetical protein